MQLHTITTERRQVRVSVRRAVTEDEGAVRALFAALHRFNAGLESRFALADGWERVWAEQVAQERAAGQSVTLLAWDGDEPIGLAMVTGHVDSPLFRHRRWAELTALYVDAGFRGASVADRLLETGRAWARANGFVELRLYVTASNDRARRFYAKAGMRPIQEIWTTHLGPTLVEDEPTVDEAARQAA